MRKSLFAATIALLVGCGKPATVGKQEIQRNDMKGELQGSWRSACEDKKVMEVTFTNPDDVTFKRANYFDAECEDLQKETVHAGKFALVSNYKEAIANTVVFIPADTLSVTLYSDTEVLTQNGVLTAIQNEVEKDPAKAGDPKAALREVKKLRQAKQLTEWVVRAPKALNKLQLEKLTTLGVEPAAAQNSRTPFTYNVDNGYLILSGLNGYSRAYKKQ